MQFYRCYKFHVYNSSLEDLINRLEHDAKLEIEWFDCSCMKLNEDKCHLIISGHESEAIWLKIGQAKVKESKTRSYYEL